MTQSVTIDPCIRTIASAVPEPDWSTDELLSAADDRLSPRLVGMIRDLGVDNRHSILANYPAVLFDGAEPELGIPATSLAVKAVRRCIGKAGIQAESIGLVLGATSSPGRLLPSLVCDLFAQVPEIPRSAENLSISYMGCSVIARVVQTARWYLTCNPGKVVLACFMDAITPLSPPLPGKYSHFSEIPEELRQETVNAMHGFLFGDAVVAMALGAEGDGPVFGPVAGLTNEIPADAELGTVPDGGSDIPEVFGRRLYTLSPGRECLQEEAEIAGNVVLDKRDELHDGPVGVVQPLGVQPGPVEVVDAPLVAAPPAHRPLDDVGHRVQGNGRPRRGVPGGGSGQCPAGGGHDTSRGPSRFFTAVRACCLAV
jgi:hypothetical protein